MLQPDWLNVGRLSLVTQELTIVSPDVRYTGTSFIIIVNLCIYSMRLVKKSVWPVNHCLGRGVPCQVIDYLDRFTLSEHSLDNTDNTNLKSLQLKLQKTAHFRV